MFALSDLTRVRTPDAQPPDAADRPEATLAGTLAASQLGAADRERWTPLLDGRREGPMFRLLTALVVFYSLALPLPAFAWTYFLQGDLGVRGLVRYCKYSNGKIYTVNSTEICPISIEDSAPGLGQGQGFLVGEYQDGMTKVCIYNVLGEKRARRLPSASLCPLNSQF